MSFPFLLLFHFFEQHNSCRNSTFVFPQRSWILIFHFLAIRDIVLNIFDDWFANTHTHRVLVDFRVAAGTQLVKLLFELLKFQSDFSRQLVVCVLDQLSDLFTLVLNHACEFLIVFINLDDQIIHIWHLVTNIRLRQLLLKCLEILFLLGQSLLEFI